MSSHILTSDNKQPSLYLDVLLFISVFKGFVQKHTRAPSRISWTNHNTHSLSRVLGHQQQLTVLLDLHAISIQVSKSTAAQLPYRPSSS